MMGDYSKSGIGTLFNTGTVVDVCVNIFGGGLSPKYIPSFSWGGQNGFTLYDAERAIETINRMMTRRDTDLIEDDKDILLHVYRMTASTREGRKADVR
jgi:hypothetical protein